MARRARKSADSGTPEEPAASEADRIIDAALALIAREGWRRLTLAAIAHEAELPLLRVYRLYGSRHAVLAAFSRRTDEAVLAEPPAAEPGERPRDRLFDLLMRRFDALTPHKAALAGLARELPLDPPAALCAGTALLRSMRWMLEAAEVASTGLAGAVVVQLVTGAYLAAIRVWERDDSPDLARTMAALDARLRRIERWLVPAAQPPRPAPA
ncbi:MAG: TetR family transcriptional regulator [Stellaceae bacterium]